MAKVRVYELAKEFGIESKVVVAKLQELGEFVRSASSTVEAPVVRKLRETYADELAAAKPAKPAGKKTAKKSAAKTAGTSESDAADATDPKAGTADLASASTAIDAGAAKTGAEASAPETDVVAETAAAANGQATVAAERSGDPAAAPRPGPATRAEPAEPAVPTAPTEQGGEAAAEGSSAPDLEAPAASASPSSTAPRPGPRPGPPGPKPPKEGRRQDRPADRSQDRPRPGAPRPGNNPFTSTTGMQQGPKPRRGDRPERGPERGERPAARQGGTGTGSVPGAPRPNPAMMPQRPDGNRPNPGMMPARPGDRPGGRGGRGGPGGPGSGPGGPRGGGAGGGAGGPGGGRGRGGGAPAGAPARGGFGGPSGGPGGPGGGRPGPGGRGRGGTAGAFGRPGGPTRKGRKSKRQKRQEFDNMQAPSIGGVRVPRGDGQVVRLPRGASLTDLGEKIGADAASLVQVMLHLGEMVTATQSVNDETLQLIGAELSYDIQLVSPEDEDRELLESFALEFGEDVGGEEALEVRPPVVSVMGHVDHGKTKLLDAVRHADVVAGEAGGITQHIGAYQVATEVDGNPRRITFIDTPGHEAFTAMRARGAQSTDIAILVVAADDGVMPQTIEALNHARAANVPVVVAVTKIDLATADPTKVRGQLSEYGLVPEEYGGDTMFVDVNARGRENIDSLLEAVVLTADATLDLRANPAQDAQGLAIEAHLDKGRGPVATVLVQRGTLRVGDSIVAGPAYGRVRAMFDEHLQPIEQALPSRPVMVLGLSAVPRAGDNFLVVTDDRVARQIAEKREARERNASFTSVRKRISLDDLSTLLEQRQTLNLLVKGDVSGSVEALEDALTKIDVGEEVDLRILHRGVGAITENDINLATVDGAIVIGFNVRAQGRGVERLAEREGVEIRYYTVIYQAIEEVEAALKGMLKPIYEEVQLGSAEVREIFRSSKFGNIAGCMVTSGLLRRNAKARLIRDGAVIADSASVSSLRRFKDDATEVREGFECGLTLDKVNDIRVGDIVESYEMREKPRT